jgi:hypothetical protein
MPAEVKTHGEVQVKDAPVRLEDVVIGEAEGVRIYARTNPSGQRTLNGSHREKGAIERVARRLHALGYGVKVEGFVLDAAHHYDLEAVWAGRGEPPPLFS